MRATALGIGVTFIIGGVPLILSGWQVIGWMCVVFGVAISVAAFGTRHTASAVNGVTWRQHVQTREQLRKEIAAQKPRSLTEAQRIAIERGLSPYRDWQQDHPDIDIDIAIYPMMTAPDTRQFADSIGVVLRAGGFTVRVAQPSAWNGDPPDVTGLMLIAPAGDDPDENVPRLGAWIVAAFASAGITVVRREEPGWWQLCLLVGRKTDPS